MISVALIEDNLLVREGISVLLNQVTDLRVVAAGSGGDTSLLRQVNPQVVLLDVGLRNGDSLRVAEKVKKEFPECKIIVMDLLPVHEEIVEFVNAGVSGFIMKDATLEDLASTIRTVAEGFQQSLRVADVSLLRDRLGGQVVLLKRQRPFGPDVREFWLSGTSAAGSVVNGLR